VVEGAKPGIYIEFDGVANIPMKLEGPWKISAWASSFSQ
jgi:hypothetical protein